MVKKKIGRCSAFRRRFCKVVAAEVKETRGGILMETNKLSWKGMAVALAVLWGVGLFLVGALNFYRPGYGQPFLQIMHSVYPGYDGLASWKSIGILTACGFWDGALCAAAFALIYNLCLGRRIPSSKQ